MNHYQTRWVALFWSENLSQEIRYYSSENGRHTDSRGKLKGGVHQIVCHLLHFTCLPGEFEFEYLNNNNNNTPIAIMRLIHTLPTLVCFVAGIPEIVEVQISVSDISTTIFFPLGFFGLGCNPPTTIYYSSPTTSSASSASSEHALQYHSSTGWVIVDSSNKWKCVQPNPSFSPSPNEELFLYPPTTTKQNGGKTRLSNSNTWKW